MTSCFVIMPLTTPPSALEQYRNDDNHFNHVLDHLFAPAIDAAGYDLRRPSMRGADLIHAEIIRNLEEADLVLCDVSQLNANVFFELGIRTAVDRPVALVKDDKTATYPFDTTMINYHSYDSSLAPWTLQQEIKALEEHLKATASRADGRNSLWRYFGLTQRAKPADIANPVEAKLDLLLGEVEKLRNRRGGTGPLDSPSHDAMRDLLRQLTVFEEPGRSNTNLRNALVRVLDVADENHARLTLLAATKSSALLEVRGSMLSDDQRRRIRDAGEENDVKIVLLDRPDDQP